MIIFIIIFFSIFLYALIAGVTHGYAKHTWPSEKIQYGEVDDSEKRTLVTILWPFYWIFIWPLNKANDMTFSYIEKKAAIQVAKNRIRIADLSATRDQLKASNVELEEAEVELEKELSR